MTEAPSEPVPTLYDWVGGEAALNALTKRFYGKVLADPLIGPVFAGMIPEHPAHVAMFIGEVFGGPKTYSQTRGGHPHMIREHLGRHLDEAKRRRWVAILMDTAEEVGLAADPEFRSAFAGYIEWGSRLAVINSQDGAEVVADAPMPVWGWGPPGGPYRG